MSYRPSVICVDFESALTNGAPSTEYYRDDFRVVSAAFAWRGKAGELRSLFLVGEDEVGAFLRHVQASGAAVCVHNFQFEYGVSLYRFPGFEAAISVDTMRLVQVGDNGGKLAHYVPKVQTYDDLLDAIDGVGEREKPPSIGLGLVAAASRWLPPEWQDHKGPFHAWLRENCGIKKGHEGRNLDKLPLDMLEAYNVADAKVTLLLYETLTEKFASEGYDWKLDHTLYKSTARMVAQAKGIGADVDAADLQMYVQEIQAEVDAIEAKFRAYFATQVQLIEEARSEAYVMSAKTAKGQERRRAAIQQDPTEIRFNLGSTKQLKTLFVDILGQTPKFWTKEPKRKPGKERKKPFEPSPSFKSAHLSTYGEGGELLIKRRKRLLVMQQATALIKLAAYDGKWHSDLRAAGTATGRLSGGRHA